MVATSLISAVEKFIVAGENDDPAARAMSLAPDLLFYGHRRTRAEASREMTFLYRLWPRRKFVPTKDIDVFAVPRHPGLYKVTAVFEYDMVNRDQERMTGKSRLTCIFQNEREGARMVGVDEKLLPETTTVYHSR
jgi:hypothetical protein